MLNDTPATRRKAYTAFESAKMFRQRPKHCERCGGAPGGIEAHHDDYAKPLEVRWLCRSCHIRHHVALRKAAGTYIHNGGKASRWKAARALRKAAKAAA